MKDDELCFRCPSGLFHAFDENRDNHIDFKEISCGLSACCRGPLAERQKCKWLSLLHCLYKIYTSQYKPFEQITFYAEEVKQV